ncbi:MAG: alpha/beta hydrolase [Gemmatimonadetes bacterium]|nr:alpha/beta hydrolase [Gemmatimonadota bacterium]
MSASARVPIPFPDAAAGWSVARRVDVGGISVRFREAGRGPAIVLAHGLGMSADYWWRNGPALAASGFRVLAPDFPGFGSTGRPAGGLSVPDQARFLAGFSDAVQAGPATYVGHSLSCQAALHLAAEQPARVRALVLASPTGDPRPGRMAREAWGFFLDAFREPPSIIPVVASAYLRTGVRHYLGTWLAGARHDVFALLLRVRAPTLVLVGDRDPVAPIPLARALADGLPNGRLGIIHGGAHALIYDRPERFNRWVRAFLTRVLASDEVASPDSFAPLAAAASIDPGDAVDAID